MEFLCLFFQRRLVAFIGHGLFMPPHFNYMNNSIPEGNLFVIIILKFLTFAPQFKKHKK